MCEGVDKVCDTTYSNCQWCNSTTGSDDDIGFCDLGMQFNLIVTIIHLVNAEVYSCVSYLI